MRSWLAGFEVAGAERPVSLTALRSPTDAACLLKILLSPDARAVFDAALVAHTPSDVAEHAQAVVDWWASSAPAHAARG